jgi:hypothetical protein
LRCAFEYGYCDQRDWGEARANDDEFHFFTAWRSRVRAHLTPLCRTDRRSNAADIEAIKRAMALQALGRAPTMPLGHPVECPSQISNLLQQLGF